MLEITLHAPEMYDEEHNLFIDAIPATTVRLEHSLSALSKWESIHEKPFLTNDEKSYEELVSYIWCMIQAPEVPRGILRGLNSDTFDQINRYIQSKQTATWFSHEDPAPKTGEVVTAELIYYWLIKAGIPLECENWHLNKLMTLIRVFNRKEAKPKKMSSRDALAERRRLNDQRRAAAGHGG